MISKTGEGVRIELLADHQEAIPLLARWFVEAWEPYYGPNGPGNAEQDLRFCCDRDRLPIAVIAIDQDGVCGTAALKEQSVESHAHLRPWLAALLVDPAKRNRGIGTRLVQAIEELARQMEFEVLYVGAGPDAPLYDRRGWTKIGNAKSLREPLGIFRCNLGPRKATR